MFSDLVIGYLFCGGAGAGACALLAIVGMLVPRNRVSTKRVSVLGHRSATVFLAPDVYRRFVAPAFWCAALLLAVGSLFLVADLGVVARTGLLIAYATPTFLTVGTFALIILLVVAVLLAAIWGSSTARVRHWVVIALHWIALALGLVVAIYTGLLLYSMSAVPFWANVWLPILFLTSSLSCGCAVVLACTFFSGSASAFRSVFERIMRFDVALLATEAFALAALIVSSAANSYDVVQEALHTLLSGDLATLFIAAVVASGLVFPLVLEGSLLISRRPSAKLSLIAAAGVLVGGFALRYCIVTVGAHPAVWAALT